MSIVLGARSRDAAVRIRAEAPRCGGWSAKDWTRTPSGGRPSLASSIARKSRCLRPCRVVTTGRSATGRAYIGDPEHRAATLTGVPETLVSIVTPSLNQARYLRQAIESV